MKRVKTPRDAKGPEALKLIERTSASVFNSRMPPRSARHMKHSHSLLGARQIVRIDRQEWEERVAEILRILERHRYERANAMHSAIDRATQAMNEAARKQAEVATFAEELQASNEEMRASNEEMRAANEEMRVVTEELELAHMDLEHVLAVAPTALLRPLRSMREAAAELRGRIQEVDESSAREAEGTLADLSETAESVERLLTDLTDYWHVIVGGSELETVACDEALSSAVAGLQHYLDAQEAEVTHDSLPRVSGDAEQITRLFRILLENAARFRGEGPPSIHVSAANLRRDPDAAALAGSGRGWLFTVSDNGVGIDPDRQEDVFSLFQRAHPEADFPGHGVGLAAAWRIVRRHGGRIWIRSAPGEGTHVHFTLPEKDRD